MQFVKFMTSGVGRAVRIVLGIAILSIGLLVVQGTLGTALAGAALIPIAGGVLDFCLIGFALGYPLKGADARKKLAGR